MKDVLLSSIRPCDHGSALIESAAYQVQTGSAKSSARLTGIEVCSITSDLKDGLSALEAGMGAGTDTGLFDEKALPTREVRLRDDVRRAHSQKVASPHIPDRLLSQSAKAQKLVEGVRGAEC